MIIRHVNHFQITLNNISGFTMWFKDMSVQWVIQVCGYISNLQICFVKMLQLITTIYILRFYLLFLQRVNLLSQTSLWLYHVTRQHTRTLDRARHLHSLHETPAQSWSMSRNSGKNKIKFTVKGYTCLQVFRNGHPSYSRPFLLPYNSQCSTRPDRKFLEVLQVCTVAVPMD